MDRPIEARLSAACNPALKPLFGEIGDLKRVRSAARDGTIASRLFRSAWCDLVDGAAPASVALRTTADALAATRLGDIDEEVLGSAGLDPGSTCQIRRAAIESVADVVSGPLVHRLIDALDMARPASTTPPPAFVARLEQQPRAGATCPGKPRVILEPPENHAEHCVVVAIIGVLLTPTYGADPAAVFLASLAHHLHNAELPDAGFTGEVLLGRHLAPVMERFTERALQDLPQPLQHRTRVARTLLRDADTPDGKAFHAADAIDRVMQLSQHLKVSTLTMAHLMGDMALVHDGPVKSFQDGVLAEMALP